jgi:hypothetical protein
MISTRGGTGGKGRNWREGEELAGGEEHSPVLLTMEWYWFTWRRSLTFPFELDIFCSSRKTTWHIGT